MKGTYEFERPGIGQNLVYMAATGFICFITLLILEHGVFECIIHLICELFNRKLPPLDKQQDIDDDVLNEKKRIEAMTEADLESTNLVVKSLSKLYGNFLAVNQISVGIQRYAVEKSIEKRLKFDDFNLKLGPKHLVC